MPKVISYAIQSIDMNRESIKDPKLKKNASVSGKYLLNTLSKLRNKWESSIWDEAIKGNRKFYEQMKVLVTSNVVSSVLTIEARNSNHRLKDYS